VVDDLLGHNPYFDEAFYVGFNVGGYELGLLPDANPADGAVVYGGVEDVEATVASAVALGATVISPATGVGDAIVTASVRLVDSSVVGFIFNPHVTPT
jgi:predicted enzyme related to lactoylglutathione lyase